MGNSPSRHLLALDSIPLPGERGPPLTWGKEMKAPWYSVKCLFHHPTRKGDGEDFLYEERVTLWKAGSFEEAHRLAEEEALHYASEAKCVFVTSTDSFHLFAEELSAGAEVYSSMRGSNLEPSIYRETFCVTARDRLKPLRKEGAHQPTEPSSAPAPGLGSS